MSPKKKRLDEIVGELGDQHTFDAIMRGRLDPKIGITGEEIAEFRRQLDVVADLPAADRGINVSEGGRVYVVSIQDATQGITYLTLVKDGKIVFTENPQHTIDWDAMRRSNLVGYNSINEVFASALANRAVPNAPKVPPVHRKPPKPKDPDKPGKPPRPPRRHPLIFVDPTLSAYIRNHADYVSFVAFKKSRKGESTAIAPRDLEAVLPESLVEKLRDHQLKIDAFRDSDFFRRHKEPILSARNQKRLVLMTDDAVRRIAVEYLKTLGTGQNRYDFLRDHDRARVVYFAMKDRQPTVPHVLTQELVDIVRQLALRSYFPTESASSQAAREKYDAILRATAKWVQVAQATDFVLNKDQIRDHVLPMFETAKRAGGAADEETPQSEQTYEGMRRLILHVTDPDALYTIEEVPFIIRGLSTLGYLPKRTADPEKSADMTVRGAETQFGSTATHLLQRLPVYEPVLQKALDGALKDNAIAQDTPLAKRTDYGTLARVLYEHIPKPVRTRIFTRLDDPREPLVGLKGDERTDDGAMLYWVLSMYVAIRRDAIAKQIANHYTKS